MKADYWEPGDQVFVTGGQRYGLNAALRTVWRGAINAKPSSQDESQSIQKVPGDTLDTLQQLSVTNICFCGNIIPGKRRDRQYCSPKCRKQASRGKQLVLSEAK